METLAIVCKVIVALSIGASVFFLLKIINCLCAPPPVDNATKMALRRCDQLMLERKKLKKPTSAKNNP